MRLEDGEKALPALIEAARKWSAELTDYIIPFNENTTDPDAAEEAANRAAEVDGIDEAIKLLEKQPGTETVIFHWVNQFGECYECGEPAAYLAPDLVFTNISENSTRITIGHRLCPICAALHASYGERLERLWKDEEESDG